MVPYICLGRQKWLSHPRAWAAAGEPSQGSLKKPAQQRYSQAQLQEAALWIIEVKMVWKLPTVDWDGQKEKFTAKADS